ncbi:MAG: PIG-L deacetylase family protein [Chloroflexota bacterium]
MNRTVLAIMAHPDDAELTCAASLARWASEGDRVLLLIATDGSRGGKEVGADSQRIQRLRHAEQEASASMLGIEDVLYLGLEDGTLENDRELRRRLVEVVRRVRPQAVIVVDPLTVIYRNEYVNHRDHRMLGMATLDALYPEASNAGYFPEQIEAGLMPHKVPELLLANSEEANCWIDVSDTLERRFDALRRHASQISLWPENGEGVIMEQRRVAAAVGTEHGVRYAEGFRRIVVNPLT